MRTIRRDAGAAPQIEDYADADTDACRQRAAEFAIAIIASRIPSIERYGEATYLAFRQCRWIERAAWDAFTADNQRINAARRLQTHKGRLARLARD